LKVSGHEPIFSRTDDSIATRVKTIGHPEQCLYAKSEDETVGNKLRIELERRSSFFFDFARAAASHSLTC
jgi:hypothetical protein